MILKDRLQFFGRMTETEKIADVLCLLRSGKGQVYTHDLIIHGELHDTGLGLTLAGLIHIVAEDDILEPELKLQKEVVGNAGCLAVETDCRKAGIRNRL